jgi:hypothetical protein
MNTNFVLPGQVNLFALAALFHSRLLTWIYEGYFGALRMGGGFMQVQAPQLRVVPIPNLPVSLDDEALEGLVPETAFGTLDTSHAELSMSDPNYLYAALRVVGRAWYAASCNRLAARRLMATGLLEDLGCGARREAEPAFVMPRQEALLDAIEDPAATDLSAFWTAFRLTARNLRVQMTSGREEAVLRRVQEGHQHLVDLVQTIAAAQHHTDQLAYAIYGLDDQEVARVERGQAPPPGIVIDDAT